MKDDQDWKLKLRYGKVSTVFSHFTVIADGVAGDLIDSFECRKGAALMTMKAWASDADESVDLIKNIGEQIGFTVIGNVEVYKTDPEQAPKDKPYGYAIFFTSYDET